MSRTLNSVQVQDPIQSRADSYAAHYQRETGAGASNCTCAGEPGRWYCSCQKAAAARVTRFAERRAGQLRARWPFRAD